MRRIWIIGNSGAARECYWIYRDMLAASAETEKNCEFKGFLSWRGYPENLKTLAEMLKGEALDYPPQNDDEFIIGMGEPDLRADVYATMKARGANFFTLLHPLSDINPSAEIGEANVFQRSCSVYCDARLGNANYLNGAVNLSHDVHAGDANFFGPYALILGNCRIGSRNLFAVRTTLLPNARVGNGNIFSPGCVVYKGCGSGKRLAGNPAVPIGAARSGM